MIVPDVWQNSSARPPTDDVDRWLAPANASQPDQITVGSEEIPGLSHAMDSSHTGGFGSAWISRTKSLEQAQYQSEYNPLRPSLPVTISYGMEEPPRKRPRLDRQINVAEAVPMQNYEYQTATTVRLAATNNRGLLHSSQSHVVTATTPTVPTIMTSLQQNDAEGDEARRDVIMATSGNAWDFVQDPNLWFDFDSFGDTCLWPATTHQAVTDEPHSFPTS